ncbi:MAG: transcription antitermination protein NusB [Actinomycetota bacterium]|jgi:N utilization substance protein B|nr:transcription antitermination protein NusB [Actinomycetota bacterium]
MKGRRAARRLALDVLYEAEIRDRLPLEAFQERRIHGWVVPTLSDDETEPDPPETEPSFEALQFAEVLVQGVQEHHADIDFLIGKYADRWAIERMPVVDRTLLRMAMFELLWGGDTPVAVAINEAVELAKSLSTEDSGRFINGLLGRVVEKELAG